MTPQFRDKKQIARKRFITQIIIFVVVFLFLSIGVFFYYSSNFLNIIGRPIWSAKSVTVGLIDSTVNVLRTKSSVEAENAKLKSENSTLLAEMTDYEILKGENASLKELLGRISGKHKFILANILAKPDLSPYDTIIIDAGTNLGVSVGTMIYGDGKFPIGEVSKLYSSTSLVALYSNPGKITNALLDGSNNTVELVGRGGGNFDMKIPQESVANKGQLIVLPSSTTMTPEVIAIVAEVTSSPSDPYKTVLLRSPVNIQNLKWVEIEKD
jgi:cell shape-determining protein MreC